MNIYVYGYSFWEFSKEHIPEMYDDILTISLPKDIIEKYNTGDCNAIDNFVYKYKEDVDNQFNKIISTYR